MVWKEFGNCFCIKYFIQKVFCVKVKKEKGVVDLFSNTENKIGEEENELYEFIFKLSVNCILYAEKIFINS